MRSFIKSIFIVCIRAVLHPCLQHIHIDSASSSSDWELVSSSLLILLLQVVLCIALGWICVPSWLMCCIHPPMSQLSSYCSCCMFGSMSGNDHLSSCRWFQTQCLWIRASSGLFATIFEQSVGDYHQVVCDSIASSSQTLIRWIVTTDLSIITRPSSTLANFLQALVHISDVVKKRSIIWTSSTL